MAAGTLPRGLLFARADQFRQALEAQDDLAVQVMLDAWVARWFAVQQDLDDFLGRVARARAAGQPTSPAWAYQQGRLDALLDTVAREVTRYAAAVSGVITDAQRGAIVAAASHVPQLLADAGASPLSVDWYDTNARDLVETAVGLMGDGSPLVEHLSRTMTDETVEGIRQTLLDGLAAGKGQDWVRRHVAADWGVPASRAETIMRTESLRVYRESTRRAYDADEGVVSWTWHANIGDPRTCLACVLLHGTEHPTSSILDGHPRCRCAMLPTSESWADILGDDAEGLEEEPAMETGVAWLERQPERVQVALVGRRKWEAWQAGEFAAADMVARRDDPAWGTMRYERSLLAIREGRDANWWDPMPSNDPQLVENPVEEPPAIDWTAVDDETLKASLVNPDARRELVRRLKVREEEARTWRALDGVEKDERVKGLLGPTMVERARYVYARGHHTVIAEVPLTRAQQDALLEHAGVVLDASRPMLEGKPVLVRVPAKDAHFRGTKRITLGYVRQGIQTIHVNPRLAKADPKLLPSLVKARESGHFMPAANANPDLLYTLAHEMGHVVDFIHNHTSEPDTLTPSGFTIQGAVRSKARRFWLDRKADLSKYGTSSPHEGYAEAFADWLLGEAGETLGFREEYGWHRHHDHQH